MVGDTMKIHYGKTEAKPEEIGYSPEALERLNGHFQRLISEKKIQAACYMLSRDGKVFAHASMGRLSFEKAGDFLPGSLRQIASLSKMFTATAIFQLMERGKIYLTQPVCSIIPEFDTEMHRRINVFDMLTHTSGLKAEPGSYMEPYPEEMYENITKDNWIRKLLTGPLQYKTGTTWNYCSKNYTFLAEIVRRVSGMDFIDYVTANVIEPMGMKDTYYFVPKERIPEVCVNSEWNKKLLSRKRKDMPSTSMKGPGGMVSTVADAWKLGQMMLDGGTVNGRRILGRKTVEAAVKPQIVNYPGHNWRARRFDETYSCTYGLGWELNKHSFLPDGTFDHEGAGGIGLFVDPVNRFVFSGFYPSPEYLGDSWVSSLAVAWSGLRQAEGSRASHG
jgi:CubicO group peptidase (beta-lactamase class C family)